MPYYKTPEKQTHFVEDIFDILTDKIWPITWAWVKLYTCAQRHDNSNSWHLQMSCHGQEKYCCTFPEPEKTSMYSSTFLPFRSAVEGYPWTTRELISMNIVITLLVNFVNFFILNYVSLEWLELENLLFNFLCIYQKNISGSTSVSNWHIWNITKLTDVKFVQLRM